EKEQLREKRRKRQEFFQEQKKNKLLPADVLEEIDPTPLKKQKQSEDEGKAASCWPVNIQRIFYFTARMSNGSVIILLSHS
ncbi:hypothetical protein GOODEAATRI_013708, partial [Goodea atripinnis]